MAHHLDPVVSIGKNGLISGTIHSISTSLEARELIKVKFRDFKDDKKKISKKISIETKSSIIGIVGHVLILYRMNPDPEKQRYKLS
tara:strand:+ start:67 stop:324 length:258 start_codon:yes stop_codon:yes gene_type:complete